MSDVRNAQLCEGLTVPLRAPIFLPPLHLEDTDLLVTPVCKNFGFDAGAIDGGAPNSNLLAICDHQYLGQIDNVAGFTGKLFDPDTVSHTESVLFTACLNYCVHVSFPEFLSPNQTFRIGGAS